MLFYLTLWTNFMQCCNLVSKCSFSSPRKRQLRTSGALCKCKYCFLNFLQIPIFYAHLVQTLKLVICINLSGTRTYKQIYKILSNFPNILCQSGLISLQHGEQNLTRRIYPFIMTHFILSGLVVDD